jgi:hypothetical protein
MFAGNGFFLVGGCCMQQAAGVFFLVLVMEQGGQEVLGIYPHIVAGKFDRYNAPSSSDSGEAAFDRFVFLPRKGVGDSNK